MRKPCRNLSTARAPLNNYGSLESAIRGIRDHRPLDLNAETWRSAHPQGTFEQWRQDARRCVLDGLHYDPGPLDLRPQVLRREERPEYTLELVEFNTTPWFRVKGYFLLPKGVRYPVPGIVLFHAWGGPMLFGKERMVSTGRDHPLLTEHLQRSYSGRFLGDEFAKRGYAVIVIDAHHFGERAPRGVNGIPETYDPFDLPIRDHVGLERMTADQLFLGVRQLNWAGTTWMGVNYYDDSRCIDYLLTRPEVDPGRIGCTGLSGGGWRTNMLAALDPRIRASVSVGWMTTGDYQQCYNLAGAVGTFCLLPGVWDRLDIPDLTIMAAPSASMVIVGRDDMLFPEEAQDDSARQIRIGYEWAKADRRFRFVNLPKPHCFDAELQEEAFAWFDGTLRDQRKASEPTA